MFIHVDQNLARHGGAHFNPRTLETEAGGSGDQDHLGYREFFFFFLLSLFVLFFGVSL